MRLTFLCYRVKVFKVGKTHIKILVNIHKPTDRKTVRDDHILVLWCRARALQLNYKF